ncbi:MAG: PQQ-binding-like beta-propeller repeat protein [bacterium]|nr:PQQ-binding-like beta-propeller repeat protein [bacterium]
MLVAVLQLATLYVPAWIAPASPAMFYAMLGSLTIGTLLLLLWWLFFSRARWSERIGALLLMIVAHTAAVFLADPSARWVALLPGVPWLCAVFVASLFFDRRVVTVAAILIASLGWTLVRTNGVRGSMDNDYAWRWSSTAEDRFLASDASAVPDTAANAETVAEAAWPGFRGSARDGIVRGLTLGTDWKTNPPREIWRRPVGPAWSSFVLVGDRLCTQEQRDEDEAVVCYDAAGGAPIWLHTYPGRFWEALGGAGPRSTPTYHDGRLYALGATGILSCLDAATGEPRWTRNLAQDSGAEVPNWGFASSPLVVDDVAIVHAPEASDGRSVVAYDVATGEPRWYGTAGGLSYSSPHLVTVDGVRQVVMITGEGVFAIDPATGEALWMHDWPAGGGEERVAQPALLNGGTGMLISSFIQGTRRISLASNGAGAWTTDEVWTSRALKSHFNDLVVHRGTAYGFDRNIMAAIDVETGERAWKGGRYGNGQLLLLPDRDLLLVLSERGELVLLRATPERLEEVAKVEALDGKTWNHPIVANGVVYLRNAEEAAAFRLPLGSE